MIRNRLAILLAERNLKITRVSKDTGISRSTLTSISQNDNKMIQMETINNLCLYLNITPNDFFDYVDQEINITAKAKSIALDKNYIIEELMVDVFIEVKSYKSEQTFLLNAGLKKVEYFERYGLELSLGINFDDISKEEEFKKSIFNELPTTFQIDINTVLRKALYEEICRAFIDDLYKKEYKLKSGPDADSIKNNKKIIHLNINDVFS
ncbi:helix-turn-helix domain-containing protein [Listeria aquatica]|uniref:helix-turn-helix domain-containing protein n=1 Tax=Listeria aquatica TaxID=1494960 RepID=UPI003EF4DFC4